MGQALDRRDDSDRLLDARAIGCGLFCSQLSSLLLLLRRGRTQILDGIMPNTAAARKERNRKGRDRHRDAGDSCPTEVAGGKRRTTPGSRTGIVGVAAKGRVGEKGEGGERREGEQGRAWRWTFGEGKQRRV